MWVGTLIIMLILNMLYSIVKSLDYYYYSKTKPTIKYKGRDRNE